MGRRLEQPLVQCSICPRRFRGRVYSGERYCSPSCRQRAYRDRQQRLRNARVPKPSLDGGARDAQGLGDGPVGSAADPLLGR